MSGRCVLQLGAAANEAGGGGGGGGGKERQHVNDLRPCQAACYFFVLLLASCSRLHARHSSLYVPTTCRRVPIDFLSHAGDSCLLPAPRHVLQIFQQPVRSSHRGRIISRTLLRLGFGRRSIKRLRFNSSKVVFDTL